ncbi:MAG: MBL fold metallo-hydrolase [candidate division KSB1 bacterium]|nr:MBL fold metallo-hydrolase [candidate division KSB1 bacterium]MDZ7301141.1 MBL fold metallo-hydrolase [candidate division KSB1 bacterium]MDZ7311975.1 MBL fold metallo-hydrolase [candidate division KSB1 bacterium]
MANCNLPSDASPKKGSIQEDSFVVNRAQANSHLSPEKIDENAARGKLLVKFWGVRGSYPVPGPKTVKYGGNTSCVEIRNPYHRIILDAGTGIIGLGDQILAEYRARIARSSNPETSDNSLVLSILLSHTHYDHIHALPFFQPAYLSQTSLYVFGPQLLGYDLRESISETMNARYCPVRLEEMNSHKVIENAADTDRLLFQNSNKVPQLISAREPLPVIHHEDLLVSIMHSYSHPKDGVFIFRVQNNGHTVVYATDTEGYTGGDSRLIRFAQGAEVLIHDAQYTHEEYTDVRNPKQGYGHSTIDMACEVADKAQVKQLVLFHHDPRHDDESMMRVEEYARRLFKNVVAAREGLELCLGE